jgi:proline iminopeptidase
MPVTTGTVTVSNVPLRYVREGRGPTAVAIGSAVYYPKAYSADLRSQLDMVFVDSRHFVPTYQPTAEELARISLETFATDLDSVRQQLGIERWAVIGHSIHAQIALSYARKFPERTTHLVIIGGVPSAFADFGAVADSFFKADASPERKAALAAATQHLDSILAAATPARRFAVGYQHRAALYWANPEYDATTLLSGLESGPAFDRLAASLPSHDQVRQALQEITAPTLVVLGRLDYAIPYLTWEPLVNGLPNVTLRVLEGESHNPQTEHPQRFDSILVSFVKRQ